MRYRMELIDGEMLVRHVQTDQVMGTVRWCAEPNVSGAHRLETFLVCELANGEAADYFGFTRKTR